MVSRSAQRQQFQVGAVEGERGASVCVCRVAAHPHAGVHAGAVLGELEAQRDALDEMRGRRVIGETDGLRGGGWHVDRDSGQGGSRYRGPAGLQV